MTLYKKQFKTSASEANLAGLNSNYASETNVFLTEEDDPSGDVIITGLIEAGDNVSLSGTGTEADPYIIASSPVPVAQRTGTSLVFDTDAFYNTVSSPATGNITVSYGGAALGTTHLLFHNNGSEPTYPASFQRLAGSEEYAPGEINYYFFIYIGNSQVLYRIDKNAS